MRCPSTLTESCPINSTASPIASPNCAFSFLTSACSLASVGLGPSSFFLTGGFGAPAPAGCASDSFTAATRAFACSTIDAFSASAPASVPADGIADGGGVPDASASETPSDVGSSEPGCLVSSDIYDGGPTTLTLRFDYRLEESGRQSLNKYCCYSE